MLSRRLAVAFTVWGHHCSKVIMSRPGRLTSHRGIHSTVAMASKKIQMAQRLQGQDPNVWVEFSRLAVEEKAINLGQGFPDFFPPQHIRDALKEAATREDFFMSQYTRSYGHPRLIKALAKLYSPLIGKEINPLDDIIISVGAYGALYYSVQGLVNPGDEAIIIEPYFDCYKPMVTAAGGIPVFVPLRPTKPAGTPMTSADWKLDPDELSSKFNEKTKVIFFNNPNNPLGKVYSREEMMMIADLCKKHDVVCLADEVYEWIIYPPNSFVKMATLPGMYERTLSIGSAGKTFSLTGWKIGWAIGPPHLVGALQTVHQNCIYTCPTPTQEALAVGFETELDRLSSPDCYFRALAAELEPKRDRMAGMLRAVGMVPVIPEGGYFMMADYSNLDVTLETTSDSEEPRDFLFAKWLTRSKKIAGIPPSAFYGTEDKHLAANLIRFCFIKQEDTLDRAEEVFSKWNQSM